MSGATDNNNDDIIVIDSDPSTGNSFKQFEFKASSITTPVNIDRDDLIRKLSSD